MPLGCWKLVPPLSTMLLETGATTFHHAVGNWCHHFPPRDWYNNHHFPTLSTKHFRHFPPPCWQPFSTLSTTPLATIFATFHHALGNHCHRFPLRCWHYFSPRCWQLVSPLSTTLLATFVTNFHQAVCNPCHHLSPRYWHLLSQLSTTFLKIGGNWCQLVPTVLTI